MLRGKQFLYALNEGIALALGKLNLEFALLLTLTLVGAYRARDKATILRRLAVIEGGSDSREFGRQAGGRVLTNLYLVESVGNLIADSSDKLFYDSGTYTRSYTVIVAFAPGDIVGVRFVPVLGESSILLKDRRYILLG